MAYSNKECLLIVLDVRRSANPEFKQQAVKNVAEILKDKIVAQKKDYVSFVLLGTKRTHNDYCGDGGYQHLVQYPHVQLATWQLLINFHKFIKDEETSVQGDWLDALVIAMDMLRSSQECFKFQRPRIVLFYDFTSGNNNYAMFDTITENLLKVNIDLVVVSPNIRYIDNPDDDKPQSIFCDMPNKSDQQLVNEKYAIRLISSCNATLCNIGEALNTIFHISNSRPWCWQAKLSIGSKLHIYVCGVILLKDENNIKLKKCWADEDADVSREWKYYIKDEEVQPLPEELIDAYMLGATPIPYDQPLTEKQETSGASLKFLGFAKQDTIPHEYYTGESLYWLVHKRYMTSSARKMDALVRALHKSEMAMICWKIYSAKFNNPKLVVLLPNKLSDDRPATLSMIELSHHAQHHFWDFPALRTQKTDCTPQQMEAIDNLIDAMDLMLSPKKAQSPRSMYQKDLLPFDMLPHIFEQNMMDVLERKVLRTAGEDDEQFLQMLADKNFAEIYWQVPELREKRAKDAAKRVKDLFPLEKNDKALQKAKARAIYEGKLKPEPTADTKPAIAGAASFEQVGMQTPAEDFERLLQQHVLPLKSNITQRDQQFNIFASQMRTAIWDLIFDAALPTNINKISDALRIYRQSCFDWNGLEDYNDWMEQLKMEVIAKGLYDFWQSVIVKQELGLCVVGELSLDEKVALEQFYNINDGITSSVLSESVVDELLTQVDK